jgi:hypothetical protein
MCMCMLNEENVSNGMMEIYINNTSIDIIIRGDIFSSSQISACSNSCNSSDRVSCQDDNGKNYTGSCQRICCISGCCCTANLTGCVQE